MSATMPPTLRIGFLLFPNVTQLDLTGPWEVLARLPGATCHLVAETLEPVTSDSGLSLLPTDVYASCPALDVICVPGGPGHLDAMENAQVLGFLRERAPNCRYLTAVCTGALVLAAAGLLDGYRATTHWMSLDRLSRFGAIPTKGRVVIDRNRMTGGGVTAGIDFALTLIAEIAGEVTARTIQLAIEYAPAPPFGDGHPDIADPKLVVTVSQRAAAYVERMAEVDARAAADLIA